MSKQSFFFWLVAAAGLVCLALLLDIPPDPKNTGVFGFSSLRLLAAGALLLAILLSVSIALSLRRQTHFSNQIQAFMNASPRWRSLGVGLLLMMLLGLLLGAAFVVAWVYLPPRFDTIFLRAAPLVLFSTLVCLGGVIVLDPYRKLVWDAFTGALRGLLQFDRRYKVSIFLMLAFAMLVSVRYFQLADQHARTVNRNIDLSDQDDYLYQARQVYQADFHFKGDRKRMPLYLDLLALIYQPGEDMLDFFQRGKQANIILSLVLLVAVTLLSWKFLPLFQSALLAFIAAVALFVYKAGYVQPELLYYFLSYAAYLLMGWMLVRPSLWLGAFTGAVAALAYLTKATLLTSLALFTALFVAKMLVDWLAARKLGSDHPAPAPSYWRQTVSLVLVLVVFLGLLSPYLLENRKLFGRFFYNANSTFYIWYDSLEEAMSGTWAHGDDLGWPNMPPDQIPSLRKYLREHTPAQIQARFLRGLLSQYVLMEKPYGRFNYLVIYSLVTLGFALLFPCTSLRLIWRYWYLVLFALAYFIGYLVMISWFAATTNYYVARFTYALYLPYLFSMFLTLNCIVKQTGEIKIGRRIFHPAALLWVLHTAVFTLALYDFLYFTAPRLAGWYGK